ncbi:MAG: TonB-dependent receptor, partial [Verrucomicrobia bacterium]|nr:TonB-dependent receptor [Verrucomicrobiota bacterium]
MRRASGDSPSKGRSVVSIAPESWETTMVFIVSQRNLFSAGAPARFPPLRAASGGLRSAQRRRSQASVRSLAMPVGCTFRVTLLALALAASAAAEERGTVSGAIIDRTANLPVEYVAVTVQRREDGVRLQAAATDARGVFAFVDLPAGNYRLIYGLVGSERTESVEFAVDGQHRPVDLGRLALPVDRAVVLDPVQVSSRREALLSSIDRKVYLVGKDLQSATGTASDLLRNVPSVQVDLEGNVSLRGDGHVLILVNGKSSTLLGRNRAAGLEQMPADTIERIEVITNPSAKYRPDGTAGIINLVLKKK